MTIYIIFFLALAIPALSLAHSRGAAWCMAGLIFLISALRYNVGWDYEAYFEWASRGIDPYLEQIMEPLSKVMLELAFHSGEPQSFFVMSSLIVVGIFAYSYIRCSPLPALSILAFFSSPLLFLVSLAIVRQSMAAAVVFFALTVLEKRHKLALVFLLLAGLLHFSAWFVVLIWPLLRWFDRPVPTIWYIVALVCAPLMSSMLAVVSRPYMPLSYSSYLQNDSVSGFKLILLYDLLAVFILFLRHLGAPTPPRRLNFFMLGVVLLALLGGINEVVGRLAYYFLPFIALVLPNSIARIRPVVFTRLITLFVLAGLFFMQIYVAAQDPIKDPYQPYQLYPGWFGELSI